ncbi:MAG: hypothetical protein HeimC3_13590 [Candidatus Heimdallarchaeota archaeon LC_3]|nr:MAG: hypothetical protein HeimC3_13590 [Candidatus Heimdallarchaeota archaeon LC_3]
MGSKNILSNLYSYPKRIVRWWNFHLIFKRKNRHRWKFSRPGLCENINHPYHLSQFEIICCKILSQYFNQSEILTPSQHKFKTKFDFIIKDNIILEPHASWKWSKTNEYMDYYYKRKHLALREEKTRNLPVLVLSSISDVRSMKNYLEKYNDPIHALKRLRLNLINKYSIEPIKKIDYHKKQKLSKILIPLALYELILGIAGEIIGVYVSDKVMEEIIDGKNVQHYIP